MTKHILIASTFIFIATFVFGQTVSKKYEYDICVYRKSADKPALFKNKVIGLADTTLSIIKGKIYDYKNKKLAFSSVAFENKTTGKTTGCFTDTSGSYIMFLTPGQYDLKAIYVGFADFNLSGILVSSGQIRQIDAKLGNGNSFNMYSVVSDKPLSPAKLRRIGKRLNRKK